MIYYDRSMNTSVIGILDRGVLKITDVIYIRRLQGFAFFYYVINQSRISAGADDAAVNQFAMPSS